MTNDPATLSQKEITLINPYFPEFELPLHIAFHCDININSKVTKSAMIAVTPNMISAFKTKIGSKISLIKSFFISDIRHLYHLPYSVRVEFEKENLQVEINNSKAAALNFTQILYRNYTLCHYKLGEKYELEVSTKELDKFPEINLDISPSQRFQFYFSSECAKCHVNYRHDICRYMHNLIITNNPVFDFSQIPTNAFIGPNSVLTPLIKSIQATKYIRGICWENFSYPDLLNQLSPLFGIEEKSEGIRMIHLVNCNLSGDLSKIIKSIDDYNERHACFISYWNLNNNPNLNFENFSRIIDLTLSKIKFLSISNCNINEKVAKEIFLALANNPYSFDIKHLEIGGVSMIGKSIKAFEKFLKVLNSRNENKINLLDISSCDNLSEVLQLVSNELPDLEIINISNNKFTDDDFLLLTKYITHSKKLREIDLSRTKISSEKVAEIIKTFSKNDQLQNVTLKLNELKLNSENLLPLFRAFLSQKESCDNKWHSIYLDSNGIDQEDILTLIPLFKRFSNLNTLSFSHNFNPDDENNKNIGSAIVKLLSIPSLKNLYLAGDKDHQLGSELNLFLQSKNNNLEKIDISGNKIRDSGFAEAIKLIKRSQFLKSISLNNNGMKVENSLNDLLAALKQSKKSPTVKFPLFSNTKNDNDESSSDSSIGDQKQVEISEFFMKQRRKEGLTKELPFEYDDSYADEFVNELSVEFEKNFEGQKRFTHSCVCMKIHLPLPFQRTTDTTTGMRKEVNIGKLNVYQTDSMSYVVVEECPVGVKKDEKTEEGKKDKSKDKDKEKKDKDDNKKKKNSDDEDEDEKKKEKKTKKKKYSDDDDDDEKKKDKKIKKNKNKKSSDDYDDSESESSKKKAKPKRRKNEYSDTDDEYDDYNRKRKKTLDQKKTKKIYKISSDESESDQIDTRNIKYKLHTAVPANSKRKVAVKGTKRPQRRQIQSEFDYEPDSDYEYDQENRNRRNRNHIIEQNRLKSKNQRKMQNDDYEDDEIDDRYDRPNRYGRSKRYDEDDEIPGRKTKKRNINNYDDSESDPDDYRRRITDVNDYDDDDDNEEDRYYLSNKRRQPPPNFNDKNVRNNGRLKDQPVKRRVKESNPKLDGTFLDPYYKKKRVPISQI